MKNMKNISKKNLVFIALLAVFAIVVLAWFTPLQRTAGVHIVSDVGISQGAVENNSEINPDITHPDGIPSDFIFFVKYLMHSHLECCCCQGGSRQ